MGVAWVSREVELRTRLAVTKGQIDYEILHLKKKLRQRAPHLLARIESTKPKLHSLFRLVPGEIEPWEVLDRSPTDTRLHRRAGSSLDPDRGVTQVL
jgi:hypothetical protein